MSPFKALYGQDCLVPMRLANPNLPVPAAKKTLEEMDRQLQVARAALKRASVTGRRVTRISVGLPENLRQEGKYS